MYKLKVEEANCTQPTDDDAKEDWTEWYYARGALAPFTVITNLAVVVSSGVILKSNVQPRAIYMFMGNLALADLLHGGMTILELILRTYTRKTIYYILQLGLNLSSILASFFGVCVIAIDRFIYLQYSIYYSIWMTKIIAKRIIIGTWIYSYTVGFFCELIFSQPVSNKYVDNRFITITPMYLLSLIACSQILLICITIVLYTLVLITVYKIRREDRESTIKYTKYEERKSDTLIGNLELKTIFDNKTFIDDSLSTISGNITSCMTNKHDVGFSVEDMSKPQIQNNVSTSKINCGIVQEEDNINVKNVAQEIEMSNNSPLKYDEKQTQDVNKELNLKITYPRYLGDKVELTVCNNINTNSHLFTISMNDLYNSDLISYKPIEIYHKEMNSHYRKRLKIKSFIMIFLVMFVFTVAWGPYCVSLIIYSVVCTGAMEFGSFCSNLELALNTFLLSLGFLNALINPFLYCWWHKGFRATLRKLCCKNNAREEKRKDFIASLKY